MKKQHSIKHIAKYTIIYQAMNDKSASKYNGKNQASCVCFQILLLPWTFLFQFLMQNVSIKEQGELEKKGDKP